MPIFDHFDFLAPLYETFIPSKDPQEMWKFADLPVSGELPDAGGGTGLPAHVIIWLWKREPVSSQQTPDMTFVLHFRWFFPGQHRQAVETTFTTCNTLRSEGKIECRTE